MIFFLLVAAACAKKTYRYIDDAFLDRTQRIADSLSGNADIQFLDFISREIAQIELGEPFEPVTFNGRPSPKTVRCSAQELCDYGFYLKYNPQIGFRVYKSPLKGALLRDECIKNEQFYALLKDAITCD